MSSAAASSPSRLAVISAYRNLLRTQREVFGEDKRAILAARKETHARFMQYKDETNVDVLEEKLKLADQVAMLLRHNVVQGVSDDQQTFKLRITKDTELGDNESIKKAKGSHRRNKAAAAAAAAQGCCSRSATA